MATNTAKGIAAAAARRHHLSHNWIDYSLEIDETLTGPIDPRFVDGVVEIGELSDNAYRPIEFSICAVELYL